MRAEGPGASESDPYVTSRHAYADPLRHRHTHAHAHRCTHRGRRHTASHAHGQRRSPFGRVYRPATCVPLTSCASLQPLNGFKLASRSGSEGPLSPPCTPSVSPRPRLSPLLPSLLCHYAYSCAPLLPFSVFFSSFFPFLPSLPSSLPPFSLYFFILPPSFLLPPSLQLSLSFPSFPFIHLLSRAPPGFMMHPVPINRNVLSYPGRAKVSACCHPHCLTPVAPSSS